MVDSVYGRIVTGTDIELAVEGTLKTFLPDYLSEVADQHGLGRNYLLMPASWNLSNEVDNWPEDQLPACIVVSPGLVDDPIREGGKFDATWGVSVAWVVSSQDRRSTRELLQLYLGATRSLMLQHQSLPQWNEELGKVQTGIATGIDWLDEGYDDVPIDSTRTLGAGRISLGIQVSNVTDVSKGIGNPSENPGNGQTETVFEDYEVEVRKVAL